MLPERNLSALEMRLNSVAYLSKAANLQVLQSLQTSLKKLRDPRSVLAKLFNGGLRLQDWKSLFEALICIVRVREIVELTGHHWGVFNEILENFDADLVHLAQAINRTVDFDGSLTEKRPTVKPGIDTELDRMKQTYWGLSDLLTEVGRSELAKFPESSWVREISVVYYPLLGIPFIHWQAF